MKVIKSIVLGALLAMPLLASANITTNIGTPIGTVTLGNSSIANGSFADTWNFSMPANAGAMQFNAPNFTNIQGFSASLNGAAPLLIQSIAQWPASLNLAPGSSNSLVLSGNAGPGTAAYSVDMTPVSNVPVPAAIWLMGSALVGLVSFGRRKMGMAA